MVETGSTVAFLDCVSRSVNHTRTHSTHSAYCHIHNTHTHTHKHTNTHTHTENAMHRTTASKIQENTYGSQIEKMMSRVAVDCWNVCMCWWLLHCLYWVLMCWCDQMCWSGMYCWYWCVDMAVLKVHPFCSCLCLICPHENSRNSRNMSTQHAIDSLIRFELCPGFE